MINALREGVRKKRQHIIHFSFFSLGTAVMTLGGFLSVVILANTISATDYGNYKYIFSVVGLLGVLGFTGGFRNMIIQSVAQGLDGIFVSLLRSNLLLSIPMLLGGIGVGCYYIIHDNELLGYSIMIATLGSILGNNGILAYAYLNGRKLYTKLFKFQAIQSAVNVVALVSVTLLTENLFIIILTQVSTTAILLTVFYYFIKKTMLRNEDVSTSITTYGKHLNILSVITTLMMNIDSVLIFKIIGSHGLATYALATPFVDRITGLLKGTYFFALPSFTSQGHTRARIRLYKRSLLGLFVGFIIFLIYYFTAPILFKFFFPSYTEAIQLSRLFALNIPLIALSILPDAFLDSMAEVKSKYIVKATTTSFRIVLLLLFIYPFGIVGVIWSELIARLAGLVMTIILIERYMKRTQS